MDKNREFPAQSSVRKPFWGSTAKALAQDYSKWWDLHNLECQGNIAPQEQAWMDRNTLASGTPRFMAHLTEGERTTVLIEYDNMINLTERD